MLTLVLFNNKYMFKVFKMDLHHHGGTSLKSILSLFFFNDNYRLLLSYRIMHYLSTNNFKWFNPVLKKIQKRKFNSIIRQDALIGDRVMFMHASGVFIGKAIIHDDVKIWQNVTIGSHGIKGEEMNYPTIGEGTRLFTGAVIVGNVKIGKNCNIGANTFIAKDIPDNATVINNSSKIIYI